MTRSGQDRASIKSAWELWSEVRERAGLDLRLYDQQLQNELAGSLAIPIGEFEAELKRGAVTVESLLQGLLKVVAPYAAMTREVLAFFARASARSSTDNLRIRFDFERAEDSFDFDLENFRDWEAQLQSVLANIEVDEIDDVGALELRHAFISEGITYKTVGARWLEIDPAEPLVRQWLAQSLQDQARATPLLPIPPSRDADLAAQLRRVWRFLEASMLMVSADRTSPLARDDIRTIVRGAYLLRAFPEVLRPRLREFFSGIGSRQVETRVLIEQLFEIFNLPVWQKRAELYSVWVGTRLIDALGDGVQVHAVERAIVFSFAGSHLATRRISATENLHVWSELRTPLEKPLGKGRKKGIQPDFVVSGEPLTRSESTVLVVECKQYLRQSRKVFADALIDYANGHPNAYVVLVNYGPTSRSVVDHVAKIEPSVRSRTKVIGRLRPDSPEALGEFEGVVRALFADLQMREDSAGIVTVSKPKDPTEIASGQLELRWTADADLDLHCWIRDPSGHTSHVYFGNTELESSGFKVELDRDVRHGGESETLRWSDVQGVALEFAVHVYSGTEGIKECGAKVEAQFSGSKLEIEPPADQDGCWWRLFDVEPRDSAVRFRNSASNHVSRGDSVSHE